MSRCYQGLNSINLFGRSTAVVSVYPILTLLDTFKYSKDFGITSLVFSASILTDVATGAGVFLVIGSDDTTLRLSSGPSNVYASHMASPNTAGGIVAPSYVADSISFDDSGITVPSGMPMSLYGFAGVGNTTLIVSSILHGILIK